MDNIFNKIKKNKKNSMNMNFSNLMKGDVKGFNKNAFGNNKVNIPKAFSLNTSRQQFMNSNPSRKMQFMDSDGDGYVNRIDCRPFDPMRQGSFLQTGSFENTEFSEKEHYNLLQKVAKFSETIPSSSFDGDYDYDEEFSYISITVPGNYIEKADKYLRKLNPYFNWE